MGKNYILTREVAGKKLRRMAYEILENNADEPGVILAGIKENGSVIAKCIQKILSEISPLQTELIHLSLDKKMPKSVEMHPSIDFNNKVVILIDDVANSGKTLTYALKPFLQSHPRKIQTLVLVERKHNAFPVQPDYVGLSIATTLQEHIYVEVEGDEVGGAWME
ncbi:MAG TPA: phosphoribosyltransferase family protein [Chitinophagaceae bacterium]|nr:phosphoribosyltransferase family protein [Chitinophagaceae bacterium]